MLLTDVMQDQRCHTIIDIILYVRAQPYYMCTHDLELPGTAHARLLLI